MDSRGVSEVIGFILIFSLITVSAGTVYVVGFNGLQNARDAEQLNNVERAFDVLDDNLDDIVRKDAPNRATQFKLYRADLFVGEPTRFTVEVTNTGVTPNPSYSVNSFPIVYTVQGSSTTFRYVNGAVIREDRNGLVFLDEPSFLFRKDGGTPSDTRTALFPLIDTRTQGQQAIGGSGTILVRANRVLGEELTSRTTPSSATSDVDGDGNNEYEVVFTVDTTAARAPLWHDYLENELESEYDDITTYISDPCTVSGDTVECTLAVERLSVSATRIDVSIDA